MLTADQAVRRKGCRAAAVKGSKQMHKEGAWVTINRSFCNDRGKPCAFFDLKILVFLCLNLRVGIFGNIYSQRQIWKGKDVGGVVLQRYKKDTRYKC
jgi:hypothetical protein